ncbi:MAG: glycosyltransferase [Nocardioides sp.]|nr:glycosyltransferase [Nocardioides sp.]
MDTWPLPALLPDPVGARVAVVSGSYGAGHDRAAAEICRHLEAAGAEVSTCDIAALLPAGLGRYLKRAYYAQMRRCPSTWATTLACAEPGRPLHRLAVQGVGLGAHHVAAATAGHDLVIATHPFAGLALGAGRARGLLRVPAVTYLTDLSVHALWVHPAVDLHVAIHSIAAEQARGWGGRTATVRPIVPEPENGVAATEPDPLAEYEIARPRALLTGGSLGIGDLERAAADVLATGVMTPVVACGANDALRERLHARPDVIALGWRDDLPAIIAASDCVVQNAGGFTSLEALASGTPVVTYRPIPGHGVSNALGLERAGLAPWARDAEELGRALSALLIADRHNRIPHDAPTLLEVLARGIPVVPVGSGTVVEVA